MDLLGYAGDLSAAPGELVRLFVSSDAGAWSARVVALDAAPEAADTAARWGGRLDLGTAPGRVQRTTAGSCVVVPRAPRLDDGPITLSVAVWPTLPADGRPQGIVACCTRDRSRGVWLGLAPDGTVEATVGCSGGVARLRGGPPLAPREWHRLALALDPAAGTARLHLQALSPWAARERGAVAEERLPGDPLAADGPLVLAASSCSAQAPGATASAAANPPPLALADPFDGKLAQPSIGRGAGLPPLAAWDLGAVRAGVVPDRGPAARHGFTVNGPAGAVTGPDWSGARLDPQQAPDEYDALQFHDDDLDDARWEAGLELTVPDGCASGLYGVELRAGEARDVVPLIVRPPRAAATADVAVWLPTFTYQAYANQRWSDEEEVELRRLTLRTERWVNAADRHLEAHPELGLSLYDRHRDGTPSLYSSRLRPIVNLRPDHRFSHTGRPRHFGGDARFLRWLRGRGRRVDLITDADLDREGVELLRRYRTVVTGSHPEYVTDRMHRSVEEWVADDGRLVYLGGNGLYWVTGVDPDRPHVIEVRRGHGGSNPLGDSPPGESHLSTTGEPGGLWRFRGRAPQRVLGVGTTATGWGAGGGYAWTEAAADPRVAFVSEGVDRSQPLGAGTSEHPWGAAGDEVDRADPALGTPRHALVLASSRGRHDERVEVVVEDGGAAADAAELVRADLVYVASPRGGRVFSVGSIGWSAALWHDAGVARVTANVLDAFARSPCGDI